MSNAGADVPLLAIVGRPNVGKSTLYNRLVGGRPALVHDTPGLTRDRRYGAFDYFGHPFRVVDTGGLDPDARDEIIGAGIHRQAHRAIEESHAVIFVVDAVVGIAPGDHDLAMMLRKVGRPVFCVANKVDNVQRENLVGEIYALGLGDVFAVSAAHGRGIDELLDGIVKRLALVKPAPSEDRAGGDDSDDEDDADDSDRPLRVAFVGKPNAGKSSLLNRLLGTERALVHHEPGTTTDPVDTDFEFAGRRYTLIDTAGIRRKAKVFAATEKISVSMALNQIERADVTVLVLDGDLGTSEQDARLAGAIERSGSALVIALNKSDLLRGQGAGRTLISQTKDELHFLTYAPMVLVSALRGDKVVELMAKVDHVASEHRRRIPTAELNRFFAEVLETHPPPLHKGHPVRIHYLTQGRTRPPTFLLWANRRDGVSPHYRRYLGNQLRKRYGFEGTPLRIFVRDRAQRKPR